MSRYFLIALCLCCGITTAQTRPAPPMPLPTPKQISPPQADMIAYITNTVAAANNIATLITPNNDSVAASITTATTAVNTAMAQWQVTYHDTGMQLSLAMHNLRVAQAIIPTSYASTNVASLIEINVAACDQVFIHLAQSRRVFVPTPTPMVFNAATIPHQPGNTMSQDVRAAWNAVAVNTPGAITFP